MKTQAKKFPAILLAAWMLVTVLPFSAITAFAADEPTTVTSIEIEAIKPADGVEAKTDAIRIKSVNGDEDLADEVSFMANKLYWVEAPSLDPSDWGGNWSKFTGTFEKGRIYALHFALQAAKVASSCMVTLYEPNGNPWWQGEIASQDSAFVVFDAALEIPDAHMITSIELVADVEKPTAGGEVYWPQIKSVNGDEALADTVACVLDDSAWWKVFPDDAEMLEGDYFEDGYTYGLELLLTSLGGAELSDFVSVTLTTPAGTYDMDVMVSAPFVMCNYLFGEVNDDGTEKVITSIEISSAVEIDPVTGQLPEYDPNKFTVTKVNGDTSLVSEIDDIYLYWYFSDTNDPEGHDWLYYPYGRKFAGGYYYQFNIDFSASTESVYEFGEDVEVTLITPTKTIKSTYIYKNEGGYLSAYWSFDHKTDGEPLKYIGNTTVSMNGFEQGATPADVEVIVEGEGVILDRFSFYNATDDMEVLTDEAFEKDKVYSLDLTLYPMEGYSVADFTRKYLNITMNGFAPSFTYYDFDAGEEYVAIEFFLPKLGHTQEVSAPTMSFDNYEIGHKIKEITFDFSGNGLSVETIYGMGYCVGNGNDWFTDGPYGENDKVIEKDETYIFSMMMCVAEGYGIDGITKDMFVLNGITPYALFVHRDYGNERLFIVAEYELPVLHEEEEGWHYDATHHWGECECGAKVNIEAHECTDGTGKCDMCGYDMSAQTPDTDPDTTPGTDPGTNPGNPNNPGNPDNPNNPDNTPDDPDTTPGDSTDDPDGLGAGAVIGIVLGAAVLCGGGGCGLCWLMLRKKPTPPKGPAPTAKEAIPEEVTSEEAPPEAADEAEAQDPNE
jgi:hypothetical protein